MDNTHHRLKLITIYSMAALWLVLISAPAASGADKTPGDATPKEAHESYLGDGILKEGEDTEAELARAVQNPVADMISVPFQNNTNFNMS